ncbi:plasmid replication protein, CyRepA1 family [Leptospira interrogans]|uniref:plasmid replication protein, CyRepA1 family n=1 Tax=Leptospira interrogans TaxID=173 RepID=UPI000A3ED4FB|nr:plasmid replication protein, CyRepA1 family [Leptospira interrogans]
MEEKQGAEQDLSNPIPIESNLMGNGNVGLTNKDFVAANNEQTISPDPELFQKAKSALKAIPNDILKSKLFILVCSLGSTFSHAEILDLLGSRITDRDKNYISVILEKRTHGELSTLFSFATNHGWNSAQPSRNASDQSGLNVPPHIENANGVLVKFNQRYLSESISTFRELSKINVIQSLQGTGKTELFLKLYKNERIVYCCPLKELVRQACERHQRAGIEIKSYEEFNKGDLSNYKGNIAICINSLHKLDPYNYKDAIVIFDEADQISSQLQSEIIKDQRSSVLTTFQSLVRNSRHSIFSSADITSSLLYFITDYLGYKEYYHFFNEFNPFEGRSLISYSDKNTFIANVENAVSEGKVCVAGLTKNTLINLEENLRQKFPEKKILLLMEENKFDAEQKQILTDPNRIQDFDAFLFTPVIASGVDISIKFSERVFLMADTNKTLNHFQAFQMVNRLRHYKELHFFGLFSPKGSNTELYRAREVILADYRRKMAETETISHFGGDGKRFENIEFPPLEIHSMMVHSENEASRNGLREHFIQHCLERKFQFFTAKPLEFDVAKPQPRNRQSVLQNELSADAILSARDISISEAIEIKNSRSGDLEKRLVLERFRLQRIISYRPGEPGSIKDLKKIARKTGSPILKYSHLKEYFIYAMDSFDLEMLESALNASGSQATKDPIQMRGKIYKEIFDKFPKHLLKKYFKASDIGLVALYLHKQRGDIDRYLSVRVDDGNMFEPLETLGQILRRFGVGLTTKFIDGIEYARINPRDVSPLIRSYRRWWTSQKDFFLKKHMFLS